MVTQYQINQYVVVNESQNGFVNVSGRIADIQVVNNVTRYLVRLDNVDGVFSLDDSMISPVIISTKCKYKDGDVISFGNIDVLGKQVLVRLKFTSSLYDLEHGYINVYIDDKYLFEIYAPLDAINDDRVMLFTRYSVECGYKSGTKHAANIMKETFQKVYNLI